MQEWEALSLPGRNEFIFDHTPEGQLRIEVRTDGETVWLDLKHLSELFGRHASVISRHLKNIFEEGELAADVSVACFNTPAADGRVHRTLHYSLDAVLSVGYRVKSSRGIQLRQWATRRLQGYLVKGFAMDDEHLAEPSQGHYFKELVARVRQAEAMRRGMRF